MPEKRSHGFVCSTCPHGRCSGEPHRGVGIAEDTSQREHRLATGHVANQLARRESNADVRIGEPRDDRVEGRDAAQSNGRLGCAQSYVVVLIAEGFDEQGRGGGLRHLPKQRRGLPPLRDIAALERPRDLGRGARPHEGPRRRREGQNSPTKKRRESPGHRPRLARQAYT